MKENTDAIARDIEVTLQKEFAELRFPPEFRKEIEDYIKNEPTNGYTFDHLKTIITEIASIRNTTSYIVIKEIYYMLVGQLLITKYGGVKEPKKK